MKTSYLSWPTFIMAFAMPIWAFANLNPGDIAIVEYNSSDPDQFSFLFLTNVPEYEVIYFTDCGWTTSGTFRKSEGLIKYVIPAGGLTAGTVINFSFDKRNEDGFTTIGIDGFFGLAKDGDQILVFQGTFDNPLFLFGLNNKEDTWQEEASSTNTSSLPPGLENGKTAVSLDGGENASFDCSKIVKDKDQLLLNISNPLNWNYSSSKINQASACDYAVLPLSLLSFNIYTKESEAVISLKLSSLVNGDIIKLEKSADGIVYKELPIEPKIQINQSRLEIIFRDYLDGEAYYRLVYNGEYIGIRYASAEKEDLDAGILIPKEIYLYELFGIDGQLIKSDFRSGAELKFIEESFTQNFTGKIFLFVISNNNGKKVVRKLYK